MNAVIAFSLKHRVLMVVLFGFYIVTLFEHLR